MRTSHPSKPLLSLRACLTGAALTACGPQEPPDASATGDTGSTSSIDATSTAATDPGSITDPSGTASATTAADTGGPVDCDAPCADPWTHEGDLVLDATATPESVECLIGVTGRLRITGQADTWVVDALVHLHAVGQALQIDGNPGLTAVDGLQCLERVADLDVYDNPALVSLAGLSGLQELAGESLFGPAISIWDNAALTVLPTFGPDFAGPNDVRLSGNGALVDLDALATWNAATDDIFSCTLEVRDSPSLVDIEAVHDFLVNTQPRECLVYLSELPLVDALPPMDGVSSIGHLSIFDLPALTSLDPLAQLGALGGIDLLHLPDLASLEPLAAHPDLDNLRLADLPDLADLSPLSGVTGLGTLELSDLPLLTSLDGLNALDFVGTLMIGQCINVGPEGHGLGPIESLAGLDALSSVGRLGIAFNPLLSSLDGAPNLATVDELQVVSNPALATAAYDAFLVGIDPAPMEACFGEIGVDCPCFVIGD